MSEHVTSDVEVSMAYLVMRAGTTDLRSAEIRAEFDRWLREVKAEAWDEGFDAMRRDSNTYRRD